MKDKISVGVISLGCDKNLVDTEKMLFKLKERFTLVDDIKRAKVIIINTCAFLESARQEALEEVFSAYRYKEQDADKKIILTGCLPQKFIDGIFEELKEVDGFLGVSDYENINAVIERVLAGERVNAVGTVKRDNLSNRVLTTFGYAYLKIADGCSNKCTYCLIPSIRGAYRSYPKECLINEAKSLGDISELILVAQDVTKYGTDLENTNLVDLIRSLSALDNIGAIRLMYCYPENITDDLILEIKNNAKVIKYLDMPLQHADDKVLKLMGRRGTGEKYLRLIKKLRANIPDIAIRSTFITGFCNEGEQEFNNLVEFLEKAELFNAGFFAFSSEEGTPAYKLKDVVSKAEKTKRVKKLYAVQKQVVKKNLKRLIGTTQKVLAEGFDYDRLCYYGRAYFNAPDVDGKVYFFSDGDVSYGSYYSVLIKDYEGYDLYGEKL